MRNQRAHTLIEALVTIAILGIILLALHGTLLTGNAVFTHDNALLEVQQQARNGMDRMVREIRGASSHTVTVLNADSDSILFTSVTLTAAKYYRSGNYLVREYPAGTLKNVASGIGRLKFTTSGKVLNITLRVDKAIYGQTVSFPLVENVRLRNE